MGLNRLSVLVLISTALSVSAEDLPKAAAEVLRKNCLVCHGSALQMSKLDLRTREAMLAGGERGPAIQPGHPETSRLYLFATGEEQPSMPPGKKMAPEDLLTLRNWIKAGAEWKTAPTAGDVDKQAALAKLEDRPILPEERQFWSFRPVRRPDTPPSAANPVDWFLQTKLKSKGLNLSPEADRRTLVRRAYLDLLGLPPTPEQVTAFLKDTRPDAWARLVDQLLASPYYGERWGRHWLDLARYADSGGYEFDRDRPTAYLYRDWVVQAFNSDLPYDQFLRLQIAGDEIHPGNRDAIIATSYLRLGPEANIKTVQTRMDELDDIIATTTGSILGMTVGCARCHNHKFDPIPQKDYYRMQAVFYSAKPADVPIVNEEEIARHKTRMAEWEARLKPVQEERAQLEKPYRDRILEQKKSRLAPYIQTALRTPPEKRTEGQRLNVIQVEKTLGVDEDELKRALSEPDAKEWTRLSAQLKDLEKERPKLPTALGVKEPGREAEDAHFLHHGSADSPGTVMKPGILSVASEGEWDFPAAPEGATSSWRRKAFAEWLTTPSNPLTARVMVNRVWQHHFGEGIVRTTSNFGKTGEAPSHPELLDWLASEFVDRGWSIKAMHRLLMNSAAYRMQSQDLEAGLKADPENRLLWRQSRTRLEAEAIRDAILSVSGTLDQTIGGPGVYPYIDPSLWSGSSGRTWPGKSVDDASTFRRSVYIYQKRTIPVPMMELFDAPNAQGSCARRNRSTVATQALIMMNNSFVIDQARRLASRLRREAGNDPPAQIRRAYELGLSRPPSNQELSAAVEFVRRDDKALADFAQALFNLNEFVYVP